MTYSLPISSLRFWMPLVLRGRVVFSPPAPLVLVRRPCLGSGSSHLGIDLLPASAAPVIAIDRRRSVDELVGAAPTMYSRCGHVQQVLAADALVWRGEDTTACLPCAAVRRRCCLLVDSILR
jgi:hypothetical protein